VVLAGILSEREHPAPSATDPGGEAAAAIRAGQNVHLAKYSWYKGGFGTVIASFATENSNDYAIKYIDVVCQLTAPSGTAIGYTATTIYDRVPAHGRKIVREINMGSGVTADFNQAAGATCKLGKFSRD
jgi:hypothetical protein